MAKSEVSAQSPQHLISGKKRTYRDDPVVITTIPLLKGDYDRIMELKMSFGSWHVHKFGHGPRGGKSAEDWRLLLKESWNTKNRINPINIIIEELASKISVDPNGTYDWNKDLVERCNFSDVMDEYK